MMDRRTWLYRAGGATVLVISGRRLAGLAPVRPKLDVYKDPSCGCCSKWIDHVRASGFDAEVHDDRNMDAVKDRLGVPVAMRSCHTARVGGYIVEGHVPAADIRRLLKERPAIAGLAAPGMPMSAPGMAQPGAPLVPYDVMAFEKGGKSRVFARR